MKKCHNPGLKQEIYKMHLGHPAVVGSKETLRSLGPSLGNTGATLKELPQAKDETISA